MYNTFTFVRTQNWLKLRLDCDCFSAKLLLLCSDRKYLYIYMYFLANRNGKLTAHAALEIYLALLSTLPYNTFPFYIDIGAKLHFAWESVLMLLPNEFIIVRGQKAIFRLSSRTI